MIREKQKIINRLTELHSKRAPYKPERVANATAAISAVDRLTFARARLIEQSNV